MMLAQNVQKTQLVHHCRMVYKGQVTNQAWKVMKTMRPLKMMLESLLEVQQTEI
jgi:hypothetical protein